MRRRLIIFLICILHKGKNVNGFNLECSFVNGQWSNNLGTLYYCNAKNLVITEPKQIVTSINGQTASPFPGQSVKGLFIYLQTVNYAFRGIEKFFPDIEGIQIYGSKLKSIEKSDLEGCPKSKEIYLVYNDLETIPYDLFDFNPDLRRIHLHNNNLKAVGNIFEKLIRLEYADFRYNICVNTVANSKSELPGLIAELKAKCPLLIPEKVEEKCYCNDIKDLQFQLKAKELESEKFKSENEKLKINLQSFETELEANKKSMTELKANLGINKLKLESCDGNLDSAIDYLFALSNQESLPSIKEREIDLICKLSDEENCDAVELRVKLPDSSIAKVVDQSGKIIDTDQIKKLIINYQQTLYLPNNLAQIFPQLTELSVTDSGLFDIDSKTFLGMRSLETLTLNSNKAMKIPSDAFKDLESLIKLDLSVNKLKVIKDGAFKSLKQLQELNLNNNVLTKINAKVFEGLESLKILQLQNNKLKFVNANLFRQLSTLSSADFKDNKCINATFPEISKENILAIIKDQCSEPLEIRCNFVEDEIPLQDPQSEMTPTGYVCNALVLTIEIPATKVFKISGDHLDDFDNQNVTAFKAIAQTIHYMPHKFFEHFPNINKIVIESSKLSSLKKDDFEGIADLKILSLHHNELTSIEEGTFDDNELLEYLNLAHNKIDSLPSQIFVKLKQLKTMILSHNQLTSLPADILPEQNSLVNFNVAKNQLKKIAREIFGKIMKAKTVDFTGNSCIDMRYDVTQKNGKTIGDLAIEIMIKCY